MREISDIQTVYVGAVNDYAYRIDRMPIHGYIDGQPIGGHLCGYVRLPFGHFLMYRDEKELYERNIDNITYADDEPDGFWIGYDYASTPNALEGSVVCDLEKLIGQLQKF